MPNKIFNNEHPSNIKPESVFYGKMNGSGSIPGPKFTSGLVKNKNIDYGNQWTQNISSSNTTTGGTRKTGIMFR